MHLVEQYSLSCGLKIGTPYIYEKYYPLPYKKYISLNTIKKFTSLNYSHWQEVINLIFPILNKNNLIILNIGEENYNNCINLEETPNYNQIAFILKNTLLHCGPNSFYLDIASHYNKKIVGIYSNTNSDQDKPYWSNNDDIILIDSEKNGKKPSYNSNQDNSLINNIKPEIVANSILKLLNLELINQETIYIGKNFHKQLLENIPSFVIHPKIASPNQITNIRFDYINQIEESDYESTIKNLSIRKCTFITNKNINLNKFSHLRNNIEYIFYDITNSPIDLNFLNAANMLNVKIQLIFKTDNSTKSLDHLNDRKFQLIDYPEIIHIENNKINKNNIKNSLFYKSNKILFANDHSYLSMAAYLENKPIVIKDSNAIYSQKINEIENIELLIKEDGNNCLFYK